MRVSLSLPMLGGYHAFPDIIHVREREMLRGRYVAEEVSSVLGCDGTSDCANDVVVSGSYVGDERSEHVERRSVVHLLLESHIHRDLVQGDISGALHHALDPSFAGPLDQMTQRH